MSKKIKLSTPFKVFLVVVAIAAALYLLPNLLFSLKDERLYEDTNVTKIRINERITIGNITYKIKSLYLGDNYSVLYFNAEGLSAITPIGGAKLYQNGEILPYVSAGSSSGSGSALFPPNQTAAIAFAPADGDENIELHIDIVCGYMEDKYSYPLSFENGEAHTVIPLDTGNAAVDIVLTNNGSEISTEGFEEVSVKKDFASRNSVIINLLKHGSVIRDADLNNVPDELVVIVREVSYEGDTVVIPVS